MFLQTLLNFKNNIIFKYTHNNQMSLQKICYDRIANNIANCPEFLQEQIYRNSKKTYKKILRNSIKKELLDELRTELMEDLLEEYLGVIPAIIEEGVEMLKDVDGDFDQMVSELKFQNSSFHEEILDLCIESLRSISK